MVMNAPPSRAGVAAAWGRAALTNVLPEARAAARTAARTASGSGAEECAGALAGALRRAGASSHVPAAARWQGARTGARCASERVRDALAPQRLTPRARSGERVRDAAGGRADLGGGRRALGGRGEHSLRRSRRRCGRDVSARECQRSVRSLREWTDARPGRRRVRNRLRRDMRRAPARRHRGGLSTGVVMCCSAHCTLLPVAAASGSGPRRPDSQEGVHGRAAHRTRLRVLPELLRAAVAQAQVPARQRRGVPRRRQADHAVLDRVDLALALLVAAAAGLLRGEPVRIRGEGLGAVDLTRGADADADGQTLALRFARRRGVGGDRPRIAAPPASRTGP